MNETNTSRDFEKVKTMESRSKKKVICEDDEVKDFIKDLCKKFNLGLDGNIDAFCELLELIGFKTPIILCDKKCQSIRCYTADYVSYRLSFNSFMMYHNRENQVAKEVKVENELNHDTKKYLVLTSNGRLHVEQIYYQKNYKIVKGIETKNINIEIRENEINISINVLMNNVLRIKLVNDNINKYFSEKSSWDDVATYLIGLDDTLNVKTVYYDIINLLEINEERVKIFKEISVEYVESLRIRTLLKGKYKIEYGVVDEYAILENNEMVLINKNGDWTYAIYKKGILKVEYHSFEDTYTVSGCEKDLLNIPLKKIKDKVSEVIKNTK